MREFSLSGRIMSGVFSNLQWLRCRKTLIGNMVAKTVLDIVDQGSVNL